MTVFFVISGYVFWGLIISWIGTGLFHYLRWSKEDKEEFIEAVVKTKRSPFLRHTEGILTVMLLLPVFVVTAYFKEE